VKKDLEERMADVVQNVISDLWKRLRDSTTRLCDRLEKCAQGERKVLFRAWIEDVRSSVALIPSLHFSNDPEPETIRKHAQVKLRKHEVDDLRDQPAARVEVASTADDILAALTGDCKDHGRAPA
jgi:hypothetical protein